MNSFLNRKTVVAIVVSTGAFALVFASFILRPSVGATFAVADAAAVYKSKCASCHGADGKGDTAAGKKLGAKDFREFKGDMLPIIENGKGKMPAYGKSLGADTCKALAEYIKTSFK